MVIGPPIDRVNGGGSDQPTITGTPTDVDGAMDRLGNVLGEVQRRLENQEVVITLLSSLVVIGAFIWGARKT